MLRPFERKASVVVWDDTKIRSGSIWREEIRRALESAKVAVLLVSSHFLASEFIANHELVPLLDAAQKGGLRIIWVAVSQCMYEETEIEKYQAANVPTVPLDTLPRAAQDKVLRSICDTIKQAIHSP